mmetsp:Transcript_18654/g.21554  ORF Transcript_18654/g.21554 Transcript_18654/m.21554 type:complete len:103 (+) Transcript_18654:150-458(+)
MINNKQPHRHDDSPPRPAKKVKVEDNNSTPVKRERNSVFEDIMVMDAQEEYHKLKSMNRMTLKPLGRSRWKRSRARSKYTNTICKVREENKSNRIMLWNCWK